MTDNEQRVLDATVESLNKKTKELEEALGKIDNLMTREHYLLEAIKNLTVAMTMMK